MTKQYSFEAETERLLELLTHSIYSNKEIFLRELISNASDAIDKARIKSLTDSNYLWENNQFQIKIENDTWNNTIIIEDNGIGMTQEEVIKNIGTIAKSGTKDFLEKLKESKEQNNLIGQFWVGFYSVFMVAQKVELESKSNDSETSTLWISEWKWNYSISSGEKKNRGTTLKIFLKPEEKEYAENWKLRELIKKHSHYVWVPIMMKEIENEKNKDTETRWEQINETKAIWNKNKTDIKEKEYNEFYSSISYDFKKPLSHIHLNTEWMVSYKSILFIPQEKNLFGGNDDPSKEYGPKLFVQNVLILEKARDLLPVWLRFISGVVQTSDLPLNISREMLQSNNNLEKIKKWLTKKIIEKLKYELKENQESYNIFLHNYGKILKEGIYYEPEMKEDIASVVKFHSLLENRDITLDEYLEKTSPLKSEVGESKTSSNKNIYYITAKSISEAKANPYIDQFQKQNIDVLLLTDTIDEWIVWVLKSYQENKLISITTSDIELENQEEKKDIEEKTKEFKDLFELMKNTIGSEKIEKVQASKRLWENIGALSVTEGWLTPQMEKMMKAMGQTPPNQKRILEINPENKITKLMFEEFKKDIKSEKLKNMMLYIYEQALLLEWWELEDYRWFINRVNTFIQ